MLSWEWKLWLLWVCIGLCLGCCWTCPAIGTHPHSLTIGNTARAVAGRRVEFTFCVIQMVHAAAWDLPVSCQVEEGKRPACWQLPPATCTEDQSPGNLGPTQGSKWGALLPQNWSCLLCLKSQRFTASKCSWEGSWVLWRLWLCVPRPWCLVGRRTGQNRVSHLSKEAALPGCISHPLNEC